MTPEKYVETLAALVAESRDREALAYAEQHHGTMRPRLTPEQREYLWGLMEMAQMAVDAADAEAERDRLASRVGT